MSEKPIIPDLHPLFRAYEWLDRAISQRLLEMAHATPFIRILRHLSFERWRSFFGESIALPAHARYVLRWCLKNLEVFRDAKLISGQDHYAISIEILSDLEKLPPGDPAFSFSSTGGAGRESETLRRLYLTHNLHLRLHILVTEGRIDCSLFERVRRNLFKTARDLFTAALGDQAYAAVDPGQCLVAVLDDALRKRLLGRDQYLKLKSLLEARMAQERSSEGHPGSRPEEVEPCDREGIIQELAAANALMSHVRRNPFLPPDDRKQHETCLLHEFRALIGKLGQEPPQPVVDSVARRLSIVLPKSVSDSETLKLQDLARDDQPSARVDSSWAREMVKEAADKS